MPTSCLHSRPLISHTIPQTILGHLGNALLLLLVFLLSALRASVAYAAPCPEAYAWYAAVDQNNYATYEEACIAWLPHADFGRGLIFVRALLQPNGLNAACMVTGPLGGYEWPEYYAAVRPIECILEDESCPVGNPTLPASGIKIHREDLLASSGLNTLPLSLSYRSRYSGVSRLYGQLDGAWLHNYQAAVHPAGTWWDDTHSTSTSVTYIARPNGTVYRFEQKDVSSPWISIETADTLTQTASGWRLKRAEDDATETYNAQGKLLSFQQRNGLKTTLQYNTHNQLIRVTHPYGRTLTFNYDDAGHLTRIDTSGGEYFGLAYDTYGNLTTLTYPDGRSRQFHYENSFYPNALTGVTDESGQRIGTYSYAADGRVFETQRANAVDHLRFAYATDAQGLPETFVTRYNAQGQPEQQTYNFIAQGHVTRPSALSVPTGQSGYVQNTVYDAKGLKTKHIQQDGRVTFYTRNTKGRITREATYPASFQSATTAPR